MASNFQEIWLSKTFTSFRGHLFVGDHCLDGKKEEINSDHQPRLQARRDVVGLN